MQCRNFQEFKTSLEAGSEGSPYKKSAVGLDIRIHESLSELDENRWNSIAADQSIFLQTDYFEALTESADGGLEYRYACFFEEEELVGIAAFQITYCETADFSSNMPGNKLFFSIFARKLSRNGGSLRFTIMVLGNAFATGEHGFVFRDGFDKNRAYGAVLEAVELISNKEKERENRISAVLIKDFYPESFEYCHNFTDERYAEFLVDPNMIMPIRSEWESFEDYLASLTTKYRTKAKGAYKKSANIEVRELDFEEIKANEERIETLYNHVYDKADFKVGKLNLGAFVNLKRKMNDRFMFKGLFLEDKLVGFMSGFEYNGILDAHFVGIDYDLNHQYSIYSRMLYEYVGEAIKRKCNKVSFGRTAMEIKSTVGAFPVDLKCYLRHRSAAPNHLLKLLFTFIKPSNFDQKVPYKKEVTP
jgi:predicted N-acyltransferase